MSKKTNKGGAGDETKREQPLQAVLLADSFMDTFRPISLDRPKMLCPFNNVTMLDYSMDFLAGSGVEELFVVCTDDRIERYVEDHSWAGTMQVKVVKDSSLTNAGDALREVDKRNLVQSDPFILMFGDIVTNVDIKTALRAHEDRKRKNSSAIMTLLMKEVGATERRCDSSILYSSLRSNTKDLVVGLDPAQENRIVLYDDHSSPKDIALPCSFFASHLQIDLRTDLLDCGIDICSPEVLARMADEFDYRDIRREFVANSAAEEEEGLQNLIHAHILRPTEYAARIHDFSTYAAASKDLLRRWCYPVVPDNLPSGYEKQFRYTLERHYMYYERRKGDTQVGRSSKVLGAGMIGSDCRVGEKCRVEGCVIGNNVHVEDGATIVGSHLWDTVHVGEGATVFESILADGCVVQAGAIINRGCIIGSGCVVGKGRVVKEYTRLTLASEEEEDDFGDDWEDSDDDEEENNASREGKVDTKGVQTYCSEEVLGSDGKGRVWTPPTDFEDDFSLADSVGSVLKVQSIGFNAQDLLTKRWIRQEEDDDDFSDEGNIDLENEYAEYNDGVVSFDPMESNPEAAIVGRQKGIDVVKELKLICLEHEPESAIENLAIELNSFKFSQNASYVDCTTAATLAILDMMSIRKGISDGKLVSDFKSYLSKWAPLLRKMSVGLGEEVAIIKALEQCATGEGEIGEVLSTGMSFRFLLQTLHDEEIVSEDAILMWAASHNESADTKSPTAKLFAAKPVQDFLQWLQEEESEDGSDEDEDDD
jgi:translation initiation factor eIF-2B subunit epsilon